VSTSDELRKLTLDGRGVERCGGGPVTMPRGFIDCYVLVEMEGSKTDYQPLCASRG
jgi:hypothetical protein